MKVLLTPGEGLLGGARRRCGLQWLAVHCWSVSAEVHAVKEAGFSLIEVVVATLVLTVGLLGSAALLAGAVQATSEGTLRVRAAALGAGWRDALWAGGCDVGSGSFARGPMTVNWEVGPASVPGALRLEVVVARPTGRGPRADTVLAWCGD